MGTAIERSLVDPASGQYEFSQHAHFECTRSSNDAHHVARWNHADRHLWYILGHELGVECAFVIFYRKCRKLNLYRKRGKRVKSLAQSLHSAGFAIHRDHAWRFAT